MLLQIPTPTPILRLVHIENLPALLTRKCLHAPNHVPSDELRYRSIHDPGVQERRFKKTIPCGPKGRLLDYVPFYFGPRSPMLYRLYKKTVPGCEVEQALLIYLVSNAQLISEQGLGYVFSDGHGLPTMTRWFDRLTDLDQLDWNMINERYWKDNDEDNDRERRKQAEFLIYKQCDWVFINEVVVYNSQAKALVQKIFQSFPKSEHRKITIKQDWYY